MKPSNGVVFFFKKSITIEKICWRTLTAGVWLIFLVSISVSVVRLGFGS